MGKEEYRYKQLYVNINFKIVAGRPPTFFFPLFFPPFFFAGNADADVP